MNKLTYGSLFAGIGGFDLGFKRAGLQCKWQVEKDPACREILAKQMPNVMRYEDVKQVGNYNLATVDLICGGFPCQDVSVAGKRKGLDGERSGLWFEFHRIIGELEPRWVIIENVPGLLSSNEGDDFATILRGLAKYGYYAAWRVLDAQYFGVPQRRRRVFIVASLGNGSCAEILFERKSSAWNPPPSREAGAKIAGTLTKRFGRNGGGANDDLNGNRLIAFAPQAGGRTALNINVGLSGTLQENQQIAVAFGGNNTNGSIDISTALNAHGSKRYDFESETFIANTFNSYTGGADDNDAQGNHLIADTLRSGGKGNIPSSRGENLVCREYQGDRMFNENDIWPTLPSQGANNGGGAGAILHQHYTCVRRLTPLECERLQGFPDGWTEGQSDSQRYRQLGNAVAVPVAEWLGKQLRRAIQ